LGTCQKLMLPKIPALAGRASTLRSAVKAEPEEELSGCVHSRTYRYQLTRKDGAPHVCEDNGRPDLAGFWPVRQVSIATTDDADGADANAALRGGPPPIAVAT
jgi:hypothetical protein